MSKKQQRQNPLTTDSQTQNSISLDTQRRDFLRGSIAAATGVAITAVAGSSLAGVAETGAANEPANKTGYRLTKHIADYYRSAAI